MGLSLESEAASFSDFFTEYGRKAYAFALHLTGDRDEAMDITQEAFLRLHQRWPLREPGRPAPALLYTVVRNLAIDHLRRRARRAETEIQEAILEAPEAGPETAAEQSEMSRRLWEAIRRLPAEQREILLLRDWHGLDYSGIAQVLGLSLGTVSSRLHHAREKVREEMRRYLR